jgi:hypothetical protein
VASPGVQVPGGLTPQDARCRLWGFTRHPSRGPTQSGSMGTHEETVLCTSVSGRSKLPRVDLLSQAKRKVSRRGRTHEIARDVALASFLIASSSNSSVAAGTPA